MRKIPEDIIDEVNKITQELRVYENKKNLTWTQAYRDVLTKIGLEKRKTDNRLLTNVVTKITRLGYDIEGFPFALKKFM